MSHELRLERVVGAPPAVAFDTFTDPEAQKELYADAPDWIVESECDLRIGGRWSITFGPPGGEPAREVNVFEEIERPRLLVYASSIAMPDGTRLDTTVRVTFEPDGDRTRVTIVQSGFPNTELRDEFESGWASILDALARVVAAVTAAIVIAAPAATAALVLRRVSVPGEQG